MATIPSRVLLGTFVVYILCISSLFSLVNATSSELYETIVNPRIKISSKSSPSLLWGSVHYPWTRAGNVCRPKGATFTNFRREEKFGDDNLHTSINRRDRLPRAFRLCLSIAVVNEVSNRSAAEHLEILSRVEDTCVELKTTAQEDVPKEESKKSLPSKILPGRTQCPRPTLSPSTYQGAACRQETIVRRLSAREASEDDTSACIHDAIQEPKKIPADQTAIEQLPSSDCHSAADRNPTKNPSKNPKAIPSTYLRISESSKSQPRCLLATRQS